MGATYAFFLLGGPKGPARSGVVAGDRATQRSGNARTGASGNEHHCAAAGTSLSRLEQRPARQCSSVLCSAYWPECELSFVDFIRRGSVRVADRVYERGEFD